MRRVPLPTDSRARRTDDPGQRAEGDGQRHDDFAGAARRVDHGTDSGQAATAAAAERAGGRAGHPRRGDHPPATRKASHPGDPAPRATRRSIRAGFALESFDVMGGWRERYRAMGDGEPEKGIGKNGQKFAFHCALPVDASGELPDGRKFHDMRELQAACCSRTRQQIARNLAQQLAVYATGAPVALRRPGADRADPGQRASSSHYGVRSPDP